MKFTSIALSSLVSVASVALVGTSQALAIPTIEYNDPFHPVQSIRQIRDLEVNGNLYDVDFRFADFPNIFGSPDNPNAGAAFWNDMAGAQTAGNTIVNLFNNANPFYGNIAGEFYSNGSPSGDSVFGNSLLIPYGRSSSHPTTSTASYSYTSGTNTPWTSENLDGINLNDLNGNFWMYAFFTQTGSSTPGSSQDNPILPSQVTPNGSFVFNNVSSGQWVDPPLASGYTYNMTSPGSLFTSILNFPTGFANPFTVTANGNLLGSFTNGQSVDFVSLLGAGVSSFSIANIFPFTDATDSQAFPLQLAFNTPTASFTQTPIVEATAVPESSSLLGLGLLAGLGMMQLTRRDRA